MKRRISGLLAVLGLLAAAVAAYSLGVIAGNGQRGLHGTELTAPVDVGDIQLEAAGGQQLRLERFGGSHLLLFFGYTRCPDVCPLTLSRLAAAYVDAGEPENVLVIMVTVDPERDSPSEVDVYAKGFHPSFIGLGGDVDAIAAAAARMYVGYGGDGKGALVHGSHVLLVDPEGRLRRVYNDEAQLYLAEDIGLLEATRVRAGKAERGG